MDWDRVKERTVLDCVPEKAAKDYEEYIPKANRVTVSSWGDIWINNLSENVKMCDFKKHSVYQFKNANSGGTAFLVGAGPSLKHNIGDLKKKVEETKGKIITNLHALRFLLDNGIRPDYTVVVDSKAKVAEWNVGDESKGLKLFVNTDVHPDVIRKWKGEIWFFRAMSKNAEDEPENPVHKKMWEISDFDDVVVSGGSVMGAAYYIADGMGCKKIVFVGMDLANGQDCNTNYASGERDEGEIQPDDSETQKYNKATLGPFGDSFITADIQGNGTSTLNRMFAYKCWFDKNSLLRPIEHINATEGGIIGAYLEGNLKSIKQMKLMEV